MTQIYNFKQVTSNAKQFGGKASGLLFLKKQGFVTPDFYLIDNATIALLVKNELTIVKLTEQWINANSIKSNDIWAVRSSANSEDGEKKSFAGLFHTELNVKTADVTKAIESVLQGYSAVAGYNYTQAADEGYGIVIQQMINPDYSGVAFSHNPVNLNDEAIINIIPGLGNNLVSGKENALQIIKTKTETTFPNLDDEFKGQVFSEGLLDISKTGNEIQRYITPLLNELYNGIKQLSQLKKMPVDIEFAIADNQIYWLQIRPITTITSANDQTVWDNSNIGENYPGISLPLTISFVKQTYSKAYTAMARFLGMSNKQVEVNSQLLDNMVGGINGKLFYNITAWQKLLYQLPFGKKTSKMITKVWEMEDAAFQPPKQSTSLLIYFKLLFNLCRSLVLFKKHKTKFEATYSTIYNNYNKFDFTTKSHAELIEIFKNIEKQLGEKWIVPVLNGFFAMLAFALLKKLLRGTKLLALNPNFMNDILFSQGDMVSVKIVRDFQSLLKLVAHDNAFVQLLKNENNEAIIAGLNNSFPDVKKAINDYIEKFGERCEGGELKMETINYKEDLTRFIAILKKNSSVTTDKPSQLTNFSYKAIINKSYKFRPFKKWLLFVVIRLSINRIRDRENYRFLRTKSFHIVRNIFRAIDIHLLQQHFIENVNDSLFLNLDEILDVEKVVDFKSLVAERKSQYSIFEANGTQNRYIEENGKFVPFEKTTTIKAKQVLKGIGCCSGIVTGKVKIIAQNYDEQTDFTGFILVAAYFEPGSLNLFSQAAGIISDKGNLLSHTAILCREMGIPAIVNTKNISSLLKNDDTIQMNGATGEIKLL